MAAPTLDSIHAPSDPPTSLGPINGVAEGIERPVQASVLRRLGCTRGQGYL